MFLLLFINTALAGDESDTVTPENRTEIFNSLSEECEDLKDPSELRLFSSPLGADGTLVQAICENFSYNISSAFFHLKSDGALELLHFRHPLFRFHLETVEETEGEIERTVIDAVDGYNFQSTLINASFDTETQVLSSYEKGRGPGDSFTEGAWQWLSASGFTLKSYAADRSLDGKISSSQVFPEPETLKPALTLTAETAIPFVQENLRLLLKRDIRMWDQLTDEVLVPSGYWALGFKIMYPENVDIWQAGFPGHEIWLNEAWIQSLPENIRQVTEVKTEQIRDLRGFPIEDFADKSKRPKNPPLANVQVITFEMKQSTSGNPGPRGRTQVILHQDKLYWEPFRW
jgi:hypothetical protein